MKGPSTKDSVIHKQGRVEVHFSVETLDRIDMETRGAEGAAAPPKKLELSDSDSVPCITSKQRCTSLGQTDTTLFVQRSKKCCARMHEFTIRS